VAIPLHQGTHPVTTSTKGTKCMAVGDGHMRALSLIVAALCRYRFVWTGESQ
jgi:hypothetical protein